MQKSGVNIISCPTCGRLQSDLLSAIKIVEEKTAHIKTPLNISVMGCVVNAIGEAKGADVAIAFGNGHGLGRAAEAACSASLCDTDRPSGGRRAIILSV